MAYTLPVFLQVHETEADFHCESLDVSLRNCSGWFEKSLPEIWNKPRPNIFILVPQICFFRFFWIKYYFFIAARDTICDKNDSCFCFLKCLEFGVFLGVFGITKFRKFGQLPLLLPTLLFVSPRVLQQNGWFFFGPQNQQLLFVQKRQLFSKYRVGWRHFLGLEGEEPIFKRPMTIGSEIVVLCITIIQSYSFRT